MEVISLIVFYVGNKHFLAHYILLQSSDAIVIFLENETTTGIRQFNVSDGGERVIRCQPDNPNATNITWEIHHKNSSDMSHFVISENSTLVVSNPKNSSLQGLVNVTCIANGNNTNTSRIPYQVAFLKGNDITACRLAAPPGRTV